MVNKVFKSFFFTLLLISLFLTPLISAVWYNPFTWFASEGELELEKPIENVTEYVYPTLPKLIEEGVEYTYWENKTYGRWEKFKYMTKKGITVRTPYYTNCPFAKPNGGTCFQRVYISYDKDKALKLGDKESISLVTSEITPYISKSASLFSKELTTDEVPSKSENYFDYKFYYQGKGEVWDIKLNIEGIEFYLDPEITDFISTWQTNLTSSGSSNGTSITLPLINHASSSYDFFVDWGDGNVSYVDAYNSINRTHDYLTAGIYTITISGTLVGFRFANTGDRLKILNITQWGNLRLGNYGNHYFSGTGNLRIGAIDNLDLTGTTAMVSAFESSGVTTIPTITAWDWSQVTTVDSMFQDADSFNQDLDYWNLTGVTTTTQMFYGTNVFNGSMIGTNFSNNANFNEMFQTAAKFDGNVTGWTFSSSNFTMDSMFQDADSFNRDLDSWDLGKVTTTNQMFYGCAIFNGSMIGMNFSSNTNFNSMFEGAAKFNGNVSNWIMGKTSATMDSMFQDADGFNQDLTSWDFSRVTTTNQMFYGTNVFNGSMNDINFSSNTNFDYMFYGNPKFNGNVSNWIFGASNSMASTFENADAFNQDLTSWDFSKVTTTTRMFLGTAIFNGSLANANFSSNTNFVNMFYEAAQFNGNISNWIFGDSAYTLAGLFQGANSFNQPLTGWNPSKASSMDSMLRAVSFNQDIGGLNVSSVTSMTNMFYGVTLSTENYDSLLNGWASRPIKNGVSFHGGNSKYSAIMCNGYNASASRAILDINWTITDGGVNTTYVCPGADTTPPNVTFNYQIPQDLNVSNTFGGEGVNISYNISDDVALNLSTIKLYYKANSTESNIMYYQNGTAYTGYFPKNNYTNVSNVFVWNLLDNEFLPGTYNLGQVTMERTAHSFLQLANANTGAIIEFLNVSNSTRYTLFEVMLNKTVAQGNGAQIYYCNSSFPSNGNFLTNTNCILFYTQIATTTYHHNHTENSKHQLIPMAIVDGKVGTIQVTPKSYIGIRGSSGGVWSLGYINNMSREGAIRTSASLSSGTWTNQTYTIDSHIHQFGVNESLWYYVCANDTSNNQNCSDVRQDLLEFAGLPPDVFVFTPTGQSYSGFINITYLGVSPNSYDIVNYTIELLNSTMDYNLTLVANTTATSYNWNSSEVIDGEYYIRVWATDSLNQIGFDDSANFTISNAVATDTSFTVTLPTGTLIAVYQFLNKTHSNLMPINQTSEVPFLNITNTGNVNLNLSLYLNQSLDENITLKAGNTSIVTNAIEINTSSKYIYYGLNPTNSIGIWFWSSITNKQPQTFYRGVNVSVEG